MTIRVALNHQTRYSFDRPVKLWPHEVRLRPAAHARTPILGYSLKVEPAGTSSTGSRTPSATGSRAWSSPKRPTLSITVDLVADMTVINPFDFFMEEYAETFPSSTREASSASSAPYLEADPAGPLLADWLVERTRKELLAKEMRTIDMLVGVNQRVQGDVGYIVRLEAGVQTPEETLELQARLLPRLGLAAGAGLRHLGLAARFASGYLIQLKADVRRRSTAPPAPTTISPTCMPGPRSTSPAPAGSASTRPRACWPARATSRWPAPRCRLPPHR
jgi:transglutaminase-like putative cysteine protease